MIYYYDNGELNQIQFYESDIPTGEWKYYYQNGQLLSVGNFEAGLKTGQWKQYYKNGKPYKIELWNANKLINTTLIPKEN